MVQHGGAKIKAIKILPSCLIDREKKEDWGKSRKIHRQIERGKRLKRKYLVYVIMYSVYKEEDSTKGEPDLR